MVAYGTVSQNLYSGVFHTDTATANGANIGVDTLSGTDQSTLISSLDITGRKRTENTDTRIVLRDDYRANFLSRTSNDNQLSSLYVESSARDRSYLSSGPATGNDRWRAGPISTVPGRVIA